MASSKSVVIAALVANAAIAVLKFIGFTLTGSPAMLSEPFEPMLLGHVQLNRYPAPAWRSRAIPMKDTVPAYLNQSFKNAEMLINTDSGFRHKRYQRSKNYED